MKKILMSVLTIGVVSIVTFGATQAYFSDQETSTGNTFTAGTLDLTIDLNGDWVNPWTGPFFNESDMKPGDQVEKTISLHVDNDAWLCLDIDQTSDNDNGCNEPEDIVDDSCESPGPDQGELDDNLEVLIWWDDGAIDGWDCGVISPGETCVDDPTEGDNIYQPEDEIIFFNGLATNLPDPVNWTQQGPWPLEASTDYYIGIKWCVGDLDPVAFSCDGSGVTNIIQSDDWATDVSFYVEQSKNNLEFTCPE